MVGTEGAVVMTPEDYRGIISDAINREVESYTFYQKVSDRVTDPNLKTLFGELAGEEMGHREYLQKLVSRDSTSLGFSSTRDYTVGGSIPTPPLTPDMKSVDGLVVGIKKELEAVQLSTQLANASDDATEKRCTELAAMERSHKARLEDIYVNTVFAETWKPFLPHVPALSVEPGPRSIPGLRRTADSANEPWTPVSREFTARETLTSGSRESPSRTGSARSGSTCQKYHDALHDRGVHARPDGRPPEHTADQPVPGEGITEATTVRTLTRPHRWHCPGEGHSYRASALSGTDGSDLARRRRASR